MTMQQPLLTGPELDEIERELKAWYVETKAWLIKMISNPYPYGAVPLSPREQYENFLRMQRNDWLAMREALYRIYRGDPEAFTKVEEEIKRFVQRMEAYGKNYVQGIENA